MKINLCKKLTILRKILAKTPGMEFAVASLEDKHKGNLLLVHKKHLVDLINKLWKEIEAFEAFKSRPELVNIRKKNYLVYSAIREVYIAYLSIQCNKIIREKAFIKLK